MESKDIACIFFPETVIWDWSLNRTLWLENLLQRSSIRFDMGPNTVGPKPHLLYQPTVFLERIYRLAWNLFIFRTLLELAFPSPTIWYSDTVKMSTKSVVSHSGRRPASVFFFFYYSNFYRYWKGWCVACQMRHFTGDATNRNNTAIKQKERSVHEWIQH